MTNEEIAVRNNILRLLAAIEELTKEIDKLRKRVKVLEGNNE
jgi:cell division protein FtsB